MIYVNALAAGKALLIDRVGQVVFNVIALFLFVRLSRRPQFHQENAERGSVLQAED
jgi:hypothetical protein